MTGDGQIRDAFCRLSPRSLLTVGRREIKLMRGSWAATTGRTVVPCAAPRGPRDKQVWDETNETAVLP